MNSFVLVSLCRLRRWSAVARRTTPPPPVLLLNILCLHARGFPSPSKTLKPSAGVFLFGFKVDRSVGTFPSPASACLSQEEEEEQEGCPVQ